MTVGWLNVYFVQQAYGLGYNNISWIIRTYEGSSHVGVFENLHIGGRWDSVWHLKDTVDFRERAR